MLETAEAPQVSGKVKRVPAQGEALIKYPRLIRIIPWYHWRLKHLGRLWYINVVVRSVEDSEIVWIWKFDWLLGLLRILMEIILNLNSVAVAASRTLNILPLPSDKCWRQRLTRRVMQDEKSPWED